MIQHKLIVDSDSIRQRLDIYVSEQLEDLSRSYINTLLDKGLILVNGDSRKSGYSVKHNDIITIEVPEPERISLEAEDLPIDIVYEDDCLAVINKRKGMVTHPAAGSPNGTLVNALMFHLKTLSSINGVIRPGIVHRLDKDTSGLIIIAKNDEAHISLSEQIASKSAKRIYLAVVDGNMKDEKGEIVAPIARSYRDRKKMAVTANGRYAHTDYRVIERFKNKCLVEFSLRTGRTHQIRVHCKHIGHPITGDSVYGGDTTFNIDGQLLHAHKLIFMHPVLDKLMEFSAPLTEQIVSIISKLRETK